MPARFDHIVIAVRDLNAAIGSYQRLGFETIPGGRHTGRGTENALIRFGLDYIELLSVYDEAEAAASGLRGQIIAEFLREREALLLGYALATTDIEQEAEQFRGTDLPVQEPFALVFHHMSGGVRLRMVWEAPQECSSLRCQTTSATPLASRLLSYPLQRLMMI